MSLSTNSTCLISGVEPLQLTIAAGSTVIAGNADVVARGIQVTIGQQEHQNVQFFSMVPDLNANNTFISDTKHCSNGSFGCIAESGGVYTFDADKGAATTTEALWNGTDGYDINEITGAGYTYAFFNDLAFFGEKEVNGFPFAIVDNYSDYSQARLGLYTDSSFLEAALNSSAIPSKQFSYWPGRGDYSDSTDGLLVIGGYDTQRPVRGSTFQKFNLTSNGVGNYRTFLEIENLEWAYSRTNSTSLLPSGHASGDTYFSILHSTYTALDLPSDSWEKFAVANNGTFNESTYSYTYENGYSYYGNLVITLVGGFQVNVSADDLFGNPQWYDAETGELTYDYYANTTDKIGTYPGTFEDPIWFGLPFLTSVLTVIDYDQDVFYLAPANTDTREIDVQPLCTGGPTTLAPTNNGTNGTASKVHQQHHSNAAAIGGGVGGGLAALLIIGLIAFFFLRRRKKQQEHYEAPFLTPVSEHPNRGSAMSPPPKYMNAGVYDKDSSSPDTELVDSRYDPPPPRHSRVSRKSELASPELNNRGTNSHWSTTLPASSTSGTETQESDKHGVSSANRFAATSGPIEMPDNFDYRSERS